MKDGFISVGASTVEISVADVTANTNRICDKINKAHALGLNILVLPELCVTGYTCGDLFFSKKLISASLTALEEIRKCTEGKYPICIVGLPIVFADKVFNCAAVLQGGEILGIVPKTAIPSHGEFCEKRHFASANILSGNEEILVSNKSIPFGSNLVFTHKNLGTYSFGVEICQDLWLAQMPSISLCKAGAAIIANPAATNEIIGKASYRKDLVKMASAKLICGYVFSGADSSESTQDLVFSSHAIICEGGKVLAENKPFEQNEFTISEIDVDHISTERSKNTDFVPCRDGYRYIYFGQEIRDTKITRKIAKNPFVPENQNEIDERCEQILNIQAYGLKKRIKHTNAKSAVIGVSGGLDSTLALLVTARTMKLLSRPLSDIIAITMPCFGTTARTKSNAVRLCERLGITLKEINITESVLSHFKDINQNPDVYDVTYENAQARERTQVLMDIANQMGGLVVGTGDLSELALGWATYNGDHMSMYAVNSSVPKTLIRHIVKHEADKFGGEIGKILYDILDTPVSPELLPADQNGEIAQKTEDLVGPYELHDFFLYRMVRCGDTPKKIFRLAKIALGDNYGDDIIIKWLETFTRRFFSQQFKRSCLPDGPKVGSVCLSPRGDLQMPSDATAKIWLDEINAIKKYI